LAGDCGWQGRERDASGLLGSSMSVGARLSSLCVGLIVPNQGRMLSTSNPAYAVFTW